MSGVARFMQFSPRDMFDHILIPTDLSDRARRSAEVTTQLIEGREVRVTFLHVIEEIAQTTRADFQSFYDDLERRSAVKLRELAEALACPNADVERHILYGNPAVEILRFVEQHDVDLVVLASHTVSPGEPGRGWGTLSHKIGVLVPCPVLLVK